MGSTATDHRVPTEAVAAALTMVEFLHGRPGDVPDERMADILAAGVERWGRDLLIEAFMMLIGAGTNLIRVPDDQAHLKYRMIGATIHELHRDRFREVPDALLPMVAGVLTAAVLGQDPYTWRASLGDIPADEILAWCYTAWMVVGMLDDALGPGAFAQAIAAHLG